MKSKIKIINSIKLDQIHESLLDDLRNDTRRIS